MPKKLNIVESKKKPPKPSKPSKPPKFEFKDGGLKPVKKVAPKPKLPKKLKVVESKKIEPKLPKKLKIKEPRTIGKDLTGLSKSQMNKLSPLELMGKLPVELRKNILALREPRTIGKDLTGLSKSQMNKLSPLELMGKLPVELRKNILAPKKTGVKVGGIPVEKLTVEDVDPDDELIWGTEGSRTWGEDYDDMLKKVLNKSDYNFYTEKSGVRGIRGIPRQRKLEDKIYYILRPRDIKLRNRLLTAFKKKYKGQSMRPEEAEDLFMEFYEETYEK